MATSKEFKTHWRKNYQHLEFYPYPQFHCSCPDKCKIPVKPHHIWSGIPKHIQGHDRIGKPAANRNKPHSAATIEKMKAGHARFFSDEENRKNFRKKQQTPEKGKKISKKKLEYYANPENKAKFDKAMADPERREKIGDANRGKRSDIDKESVRFGKGKLYPGSPWWLTFYDLVQWACHIDGYPVQYLRVSPFIRKELVKKNLTRFDVCTWLNFFVAGHNQYELSEHYNVDVEVVRKSLKRMYKAYPNVFQEGVSAPISPWQAFENWMDSVTIARF